tara:strand:- start:179 stop:493 length:315 start_codon:yes stop_codon:yes gene_type:complete
MATPLPKSIKDLCTPAALYFVISFVSLIAMIVQNYGNTDTYCIGQYECNVSSTIFIFVLKALYILFWTWLLDLICKAGYTKVSWFIVLLPFVLLFVLIGLMFLM